MFACVHMQLQKDGSRQSKGNSSLGLRSPHSAGTPSHSLHSGLPMHSCSGSRSKEIVITDPYLDALTKETKARTRNRLTVSTNQQDITQVPVVHINCMGGVDKQLKVAYGVKRHCESLRLVHGSAYIWGEGEGGGEAYL